MRKLLILMLLILLAGCSGSQVVVIERPVTWTPASNPTGDPTPTREWATVTPTQMVSATPDDVPFDLNCNVTPYAANRVVVNSNPCLRGEELTRIGNDIDRYQCYPTGYDVVVEYTDGVHTQRTAPYINCRNTQFSIEVTEIDGVFGFRADATNMQDVCYVIQLYVSQQNVRLTDSTQGDFSNIRYSARVFYEGEITYLNTHPLSLGRAEYLFPFRFFGRDGDHIEFEVLIEVDDPVFAGSVTWDNIAVYAAPDGYCSGTQAIQ